MDLLDRLIHAQVQSIGAYTVKDLSDELRKARALAELAKAKTLLSIDDIINELWDLLEKPLREELKKDEARRKAKGR